MIDSDGAYRVLHNHRQFKLTTGEEIVCFVVQFNDEHDDNIVVKNAMKLNMYENQVGDKYFSFRPWMVYQEGEEELLVLNSLHVVSIAIPHAPILNEYSRAVADMHETHVNRIKGMVKEMPIEEVQKMTRNHIAMLSDQLGSMQDYLDALETPEITDEDYLLPEGDSDGGGGKIVDIFTKKTIH
jgi:hypothetical protein